MQNFDLAHILRQHTEGATIDVANDTVAVTRTLLSQCADTIDCFTADSSHDAKVIAALREPFKFADAEDWDYIKRVLVNTMRHQQDSQTRFWIEAIDAARAAYGQDAGK